MSDTAAKILYIEDNHDNQRLVQRVLSTRGYEVLLVEDGPGGVALARENRPALILVDLNIPGLDGYETTTRLRSLPHLRSTPIIALTADGSPGARERALVAGCDGFLVKPIDPRQLPQQLQEFIQGKRELVPTDASEVALLRAYNQKLVERLEGHVRELMKANTQLQEVDRLKSQFLSTLSHELRTPLTSLLGYLELFDRGMLGAMAPAQQDAIGVMRRSAETLAGQLNNLLYFQELRSRSFHLRSLRPSEHLRALLVAFKERAEQRSVAFVVTTSNPMQPIQLDPNAFELLVRSLLDNALKYNQAGGTVQLTLQDEPLRLIVRVEDSGIGIAKDQLEKIFLPFYRVDETLATEHAGSGLGLAIVQHIAEAHGGQVTVRSSPGQGSVFTVVLPRMSAPIGEKREL
ncbi:MAG: hybrid sensor histidine kinase/response regulator [Oscillochloris sp.]|nr:hybrid sensor histidine kinase/response regulator [Oscillochloris sp.]